MAHSREGQDFTQRGLAAFLKRNAGREVVGWDSEVAGFGVRLKPSGAAT
jgi:hypothetical protein